MVWNPESDIITFAKSKSCTSSLVPMTKRELLKETSSIYDPLGILSPLTVRNKILMQSLWQQKLEWDEPLPAEIVIKWLSVKADIDEGIKTELPRCYFSKEFKDLPTLHVFTDSSMKAYGACAYIISGNESSLVMAKNRVAPIKTLTIPKLELMAAVVGAKLADHIQKSVHCTKILFWSDSQVVLKWLTSSKQQNIFVNNRIKKIKELSGDREWRYCPTDSNPSDLLSRGITFDKFQNNQLWFHGPAWLIKGDYPKTLLLPSLIEENDTSPNTRDTSQNTRDTSQNTRNTSQNTRNTSQNTNDTSYSAKNNSLSMRDVYQSTQDKLQSSQFSSKTTTLETLPSTTQLTVTDVDKLSTISNVTEIENFSSYHRLLNVTAYVLRFIYNCRNTKKIQGPLTAEEINSALCTWIKDVQHTSYPEIFTKEKKILNTKSNLVRQLDLYLDDQNMVRCGGRMSNAYVHENRKVPFLLPTKHALTDLIITSTHKRQLHCGTESLVTYLRQTFWIPRIRQRVKFIIRRCITCRKVTGKAYRVPGPPPLPKYRVQDGPPFSIIGVDFTGAMNIKNKDGSMGKAYICLFTCAKTRAVHLEIVPDMTIESFMLAFRRFTSRKSTPTVMMSDNALTYNAAAEILKDPSALSEHGTTWKFIPQHAPWYGGWWERLIGLTKTCIKKVLGKALISLEVLQTLVTEVECIINDRPLTYVSSDHLDEDALTPSHLLYGRRISSPVFPDDRCALTPTSISRDSVKKLANFTANTIHHFWIRWKNEYLASLREYHKVHKRISDTPRVGDVVLVHDDNIHRTRWPLAVIDELITGQDGFVRAARVRTNKGVTIRPVKNLYPLETSE